jgi:iron complex transport system substrate-binding protein
MAPPSLTRASRLLGVAGLGLAASVTIGICAAAQGPAGEGARKPQRVVSINLCVDELVLRLADRRNIASISWLARDPDNSNVADMAREVPIIHGLAEEIFPLDPDLVIA